MARQQRLYPVLITRRKRATNRAFITRKQPENLQPPIIFGSVGRARNKLTYLKTHAEETAKDLYRELLERDLMSDNLVPPSHTFVSTGDADLFSTLARRFLGPEVTTVQSTIHVAT